MQLLITGLNGTLAPHLARAAAAAGHTVLGWDRQQVSPDDLPACRAWLDLLKPDAIAHLGFGAEAWAGLMARWAAERGAPFLFTSTAMVFDHVPDGPHRVDDPRTARDDYGQYKIRCEDAVREAHPQACIARIGWQIDAGTGGAAQGNNMLAALDAEQQRDGRIRASTAWVPACSFMPDTAAALLQLIETRASGTAHLDSNADEALSFFTLVQQLKRRFGREHWQIEAHAEYVHDQRLLAGARQAVVLPQLTHFLGAQALSGRTA